MKENVKKIVILISGRGSNLQSLLQAVSLRPDKASVVVVISNRPAAGGLQIAADAGVPALVIDHTTFADRDAFDDALARTIGLYTPDLIVLAGFMRVLGDRFVRRFAGRMINIHPSLLPSFPGMHTHRRALEAGVRYHGVTVHFVTAELDHGPIVDQAVVQVMPDDTEQALAGRVLEAEHTLYPAAVMDIVSGRVLLGPDGQVRRRQHFSA